MRRGDSLRADARIRWRGFCRSSLAVRPKRRCSESTERSRARTAAVPARQGSDRAACARGAQ
eukprot:2149350-Pleurochrysis_carterae.AAC.1